MKLVGENDVSTLIRNCEFGWND